MATPTEEALGVNELLSMILEHLPPRKVFVLQRVSKHWQAVINGSPTIQTKLFLRPSKSPLSPKFDYRRGKASLYYTKELEVNKILGCEVDLDLEDLPTSQPVQTRCATTISLSQNHDEEQLGIEPSWYRMFLTQPPCTMAQALHDCAREDRYWTPMDFSVHNPAGLRYRDLWAGRDRAQAAGCILSSEHARLDFELWMMVGAETSAEWNAKCEQWRRELEEREAEFKAKRCARWEGWQKEYDEQKRQEGLLVDMEGEEAQGDV